MLSLLVTLAASLATAPAAASATCEDEAACEAPAPADATTHDYATPAVVDCRSPHGPVVGSALAAFVGDFVGECDGTVVDASYRVSRSPELEQITRALRPASRERRRAVSACDGLPPRGADLTVSSPDAVAVFATPSLMPDPNGAVSPPEVFVLLSRFRDPPDRPPRV